MKTAAQLPLSGDDTETKNVTRQLVIKLTHIEKAELSDEGGRLQGLIDEASETLKDAKTKLKKVLEQMNTGTRTADVTCQMKLLYSARTVQVFHGEELIEERAMEDSEFQQEFRAVNGDEDESEGEMTAEEAKRDLEDVIRDEKNPTKAVAT